MRVRAKDERELVVSAHLEESAESDGPSTSRRSLELDTSVIRLLNTTSVHESLVARVCVVGPRESEQSGQVVRQEPLSNLGAVRVLFGVRHQATVSQTVATHLDVDVHQFVRSVGGLRSFGIASNDLKAVASNGTCCPIHNVCLISAIQTIVRNPLCWLTSEELAFSIAQINVASISIRSSVHNNHNSAECSNAKERASLHGGVGVGVEWECCCGSTPRNRCREKAVN